MDTVYRNLGIQTNKLGCCKLAVESVPVTKDDFGGNDVFYVSANPMIPWVNGYVNDQRAHATLIYGLLRDVERSHVDIALNGLELPKFVQIDHIGTFPSPMPDEPYVCIVAHIDTSALIQYNNRLRGLPHICRFPEFKAHVTLAYVKKDACTPKLIDSLNSKCAGVKLNVLDFVYNCPTY